jgi:hypothetical protein
MTHTFYQPFQVSPQQYLVKHVCVLNPEAGVLEKELIIPRVTEQAEKELLSALALKEPTCAEIDVLIAKYDTP